MTVASPCGGVCVTEDALPSRAPCGCGLAGNTRLERRPQARVSAVIALNSSRSDLY